MSILIATTNVQLLKGIDPELKGHDFTVVKNGVDAQLQLSKNDFNYIVLDIEIKKHEFPYVIKFCKSNHPSVSIVIYADSQSALDHLELEKDDLFKMGVAHVVVGLRNISQVSKFISNDNSFEKWKDVKVTSKSANNEETLTINDRVFTKLPISSFYSGNAAIFDIFIKIGSGKYIKLLNQGEVLDPARFKHYADKHDVKELYFKTEDRRAYINFINTIFERIKLKSTADVKKLGTIVSGLTDQYLDEIYTKGLDKNLYKEGVKLCENTQRLLSGMHSTKLLLEKLPEEARSHQFLTMLYSNAICLNLEWAGAVTKENVGIASIFHDIGLVKFKWFLRNPKFKVSELTDSQLGEYKTHPEVGYEMLRDNHNIKESVRQIVIQHHENYIGTGFPNALSYSKIYPLAQVVSLADYVSHKIIDDGKEPLEFLREFVPNEEETKKFNPVNIKALIKGFVKE